MRLVSRGDTTVADAYLSPVLQPLRGTRGRVPAGCAPAVHAILGRPERRRLVSRQGRDSLRPGRRHRRRGPGRARRRIRTDHRLRHGRHFHRRGSLRRRLRARARCRSRRRAAAHPHPADPHRGRRRRFDPPLRRGAFARGTGVRRREPGSHLLPARRPAHGHRLQCLVRAHPAGLLPGGVRHRRRPAAGYRGGHPALRCSGADRCARTRRPPAPRHWPRAASASPWKTWRMPSRRFPCSVATTSPATPSPASAAPPGNTPAWSRTRSACGACSSIRSRACCRPTASAVADAMAMRQRTIEESLDDGELARLAPLFEDLELEARAELAGQGFAPADLAIERALLLKYADTDSTLTLPLSASSSAATLGAEFLAQYRTRYGFHVPGRAVVIDAMSLAARGRSVQLDEPRKFAPRRRCAHRHGDASGVLRRRLGRDRRSSRAMRCAPPIASTARPSFSSAHNTIVIERGWCASLSAADHLVLEKTAARPREIRLDPRRSGAARDLQQPVHGHRRADGRDAGQHRQLGEHQGTAGFLLRAVRCARSADRQCAAHAGAPGFDGRVGAGNPAAPRRQHAAGRRLRVERPLRGRHAPARRHRGHAGVPRQRYHQARVLRGGARPSRRHRRHHAGLDAFGLQDHRRRRRAARQRADRFARRISRARAAPDRSTAGAAPGAQRRAESRRSARAGGGLPEGHRRAHGHDGALRARGGARLHAARAGQCRSRRAPGDRSAARRHGEFEEMDNGATVRVAISHRPRSSAKPPSTSRGTHRPAQPTTSTRRCR